MDMEKIVLDNLLERVRKCAICADQLTHAPRPVVQAGAGARLLIIGQAPGAKVHASGIPWDDASGARLRDWLGLSPDTFYDPDRVAIVPMGFCYPGRGASGDLAPRRECAPQWHSAVLEQLSEIRLTLLIGQYAQRYYLGRRYGSLTGTVRAWRDHLPGYFALPHPSPRNQAWLKHNPWFEREVLPELKGRVLQSLHRSPEPRGNDDLLPWRGDGVVLRRLAVADRVTFQEYRADPELGRYQGWSPMPDTDARDFLDEMSRVAIFRPGEWTQIGIADPDSGALLGDLGLWLSSDGVHAELGFTLARAAQGRGRATAAVREAIRMIFQNTRAARILGVTDARNAPSIALLERVGMRRVEARKVVFRQEQCVEYVYELERDHREN